MRRSAVAAGLALVIALTAARQETTDAVKLRYAFKEGQKLALNYGFEMSAKVDEIPEMLEGLLDKDALTLTFEGLLEAEVKEVKESGSAKLEGRWRTAKVKGKIGMDEVDIDYDVEKDKPAKGEKPPADGLADFGAVQDQLLTMLREPLKIAASPRGEFTFAGEKLPLATESFFSLNGLMGEFPEEAIGRGKTWKGRERELKTAVSSMPFALKVQSENTYAADEKLGERECVRIDSKFTVATGKDDPAGAAIGFKMKADGKGEGKVWFCVREGLPATMSQSLSVKVEIGFVPPGDGEEVKLKATFKTLQGYERATSAK